MKKLNVIAAGLGWSVLERNGVKRIAGLEFKPGESVFPAVTCVAQASMRTGLNPREHGMISNGVWFEDLKKPMFWEQSANLVKGKRIWEERRAAGEKVGLFFFQQSLGENVDAIVSPAPIHKHGGGIMMNCYVKPYELSERLHKRLGRFPLHRYWGPLASPKVGRACIDWFEALINEYDVDEAYLYLPTLDYAAQKFGPGSKADNAAFKELCFQLERLVGICEGRGAQLSVTGDYDITPVTLAPVEPNVILRREGLFRTRSVSNRAYPDFYSSGAFAVCDHEICFLVGGSRGEARRILLETGEFELSGETGGNYDILLARKGSWCSYRWWSSPGEAPDYASHVDIHNKPGYDPAELFFFGGKTVKGTHGRKSIVAKTEEQG